MAPRKRARNDSVEENSNTEMARNVDLSTNFKRRGTRSMTSSAPKSIKYISELQGSDDQFEESEDDQDGDFKLGCDTSLSDSNSGTTTQVRRNSKVIGIIVPATGNLSSGFAGLNSPQSVVDNSNSGSQTPSLSNFPSVTFDNVSDPTILNDSPYGPSSFLSETDHENEAFHTEVSSSEESTFNGEVTSSASITLTPARVPRHTRREFMREQRKRREAAQVYETHPELETVWEDLEADLKSFKLEMENVVAVQPEPLKLSLLNYQKEGLAWLKKQENTKLKGGILADEMGMGKTISMLSLLLDTHCKRSTLVVAPLVAIKQWESEIQRHVKEESQLKVLIFHGSNRPSNVEAILKFDVVITSYSVIENAFRKQEYGFKRKEGKVFEKSVLHSIKWCRIILDEAHSIKDRSCNTARAVFQLESDIKWSLTGTPLQNRVGELYSLVCDVISLN